MNGDAERRDRSRTPSPLSRSNSRGSIGHPSPGRTTLLKRNQSLSAKQIRFYRNGDRYFSGLKLAVSSERYKEFFPLLVELSNKLDLPTGAVRYIFEAETGKQVTDVSQLNSNSSYVCSSSNSFKEIEGGYGQSHAKSWSVAHAKQDRGGELKNWSKSSGKLHESSKRDFIKPKLVTVVKNGKPPQKKVTMLLNKKTAVDLNQVLDHLSSKGTLGKVDRLCCLDGKEIRGLPDLFNEDMIFIAFSSNERFPEEGFDVDVQSSKYSWNTSIRPTRKPYSPSLRTELDLPWKQVPRARCLACALKALTTCSTPPPLSQSNHRSRPKSAGPRLNSSTRKSRRSDPGRPSTAEPRYLQLTKSSKASRVSPVSSSEKIVNSSGTPRTTTGKKTSTSRLRFSFPIASTPKSSTKKSLSFSVDTKGEETTDSAPKPKGIRGGGRRRKAAELALVNGEELNPDDPRNAYYILIHEELAKSGKPTASVKPIMSVDSLVPQQSLDATTEAKVENTEVSTSSGDTIMVNGISQTTVDDSGEIKIVTITKDVSTTVVEDEKAPIIVSDEKPATPAVQLVDENMTESPPNAERDWSKPKAIRGRRKKQTAAADVNGNEQKKTEEISEDTIKQNGVENEEQKPLVINNNEAL